MVTGHRNGKLGVQITSGTNQILSDVSVTLGGENQGMDPHRLLEASLTSCTIITLEMYAKLKKIELNDIEVTVHIESEGIETLMTRQIRFFGEMTIEQKTKLIEIADKCPIHRLLSRHIIIETKSI